VEKGRLSWANEEFQIQEQVRYVNNHALPLFKKFKGAGKMDNRSLAVLENLLQMRLIIAQKKDQPLFKIMSNSSLMAMAYMKPAAIDQILKTRALSARQVNMYGQLCVDAIVKAAKLDNKDLPSYPRAIRPKKDIHVQARIKRLKKMREKQSSSLGIEFGFLLNNALIDSIAIKNPATSEDLLKIGHLRHWQVEAIGKNIISTLG